VNCKIKTLKKRDTKDLYAKADSKIIKNLIGYKSKIYYEKSKYKTISINTDKLNLNNAKRKILKNLN
jgi:adenylylsulfate kinase-like enzyme